MSVKMGQTAKNNITEKPLPPINAVQDFIFTSFTFIEQYA